MPDIIFPLQDTFIAENPCSAYWRVLLGKNSKTPVRLTGHPRSRFYMVPFSPFIYVAGMIGYAASCITRLIAIVYDIFLVIGAACIGANNELNERVTILSGSLLKLGVAILGIACPPIAYVLDEWIRTRPLWDRDQFSISDAVIDHSVYEDYRLQMQPTWDAERERAEAVRYMSPFILEALRHLHLAGYEFETINVKKPQAHDLHLIIMTAQLLFIMGLIRDIKALPAERLVGKLYGALRAQEAELEDKEGKANAQEKEKFKRKRKIAKRDRDALGIDEINVQVDFSQPNIVERQLAATPLPKYQEALNRLAGKAKLLEAADLYYGVFDSLDLLKVVGTSDDRIPVESHVQTLRALKPITLTIGIISVIFAAIAFVVLHHYSYNFIACSVVATAAAFSVMTVHYLYFRMRKDRVMQSIRSCQLQERRMNWKSNLQIYIAAIARRLEHPRQIAVNSEARRSMLEDSISPLLDLIGQVVGTEGWDKVEYVVDGALKMRAV